MEWWGRKDKERKVVSFSSLQEVVPCRFPQGQEKDAGAH